MSRVPPKTSTVKRLFALSGNICAFPSCEQRMVNERGIVIGEICHIEAAEPGGQRYNARQTDEDRRKFENLILLCGSHHKETNDVTKFTIEDIRSMKENHEHQFINSEFVAEEHTIEQAINRYTEQLNKNYGFGGQINNQSETQNIGNQIGLQNNYFLNNEDEPLMGKESYRPVNKASKKKIDILRKDASPPTQDVIDFRNDLLVKRPSPIYEMPVKELSFRKKNGRIKSEVESYEKIHGVIDENSNEGQSKLRDFLASSDPEKKEILKQQIRHKGQLHPAIITCDGFLVNGNRRKMIFDELYESTHQDAKYENMRVIILPENVSNFDIKRIENRYQLQDEGKSEYHGLNRALTLRDNERDGYSLKAQILEDPQYADKEGKALDAAVRDFHKRFLNPLKCVDRYLKLFKRDGLYNTISVSTGDKDGRWQAFIDYASFYHSSLENEKKRMALGIGEHEIGPIENAIFKIIRKRNLNSVELERQLGKVHAFVRGGNLKKYLTNPIAKKCLINIAKKVDEDIEEEVKVNKDGERDTPKVIDEKWGNKFKNEILGNLMRAYKAVHDKEERDKPLDLLEDSLKKLNHQNLVVNDMDVSHFEKALTLTELISKKADEIHYEIDKARYKLKKLGKRKDI